MKPSNFFTATVATGLLVAASFSPAFAGMNKTETQRFQALGADVQGLAGQLPQINNRIGRLEQLLNASNMQQMYQRLQTLDEENRQLRGQLEELSHRLKQFQDRDQKLTQDFDQRLQEVESRRGSSYSSVAPATMENDPTPYNQGLPPGEVIDANVLDEQSQYRQSFDYLKSGQNQAAISSFQTFLRAYPDSSMAPNAQYWLGEANYAAGKFEQAAGNFETVLSQYPGTAKVPDASLKLGYSLYELSQWDKAKSVLQSIVTTHAGSSAAQLASTRLNRIKQEGH